MRAISFLFSLRKGLYVADTCKSLWRRLSTSASEESPDAPGVGTFTSMVVPISGLPGSLLYSSPRRSRPLHSSRIESGSSRKPIQPLAKREVRRRAASLYAARRAGQNRECSRWIQHRPEHFENVIRDPHGVEARLLRGPDHPSLIPSPPGCPDQTCRAPQTDLISAATPEASDCERITSRNPP